MLLIALLVVVGVGAATASARPRANLANLQWRTWWGQVSMNKRAVTLSSQVPTTPDETHSALITSTRTWGDQTFAFTTTTLDQLRVGSAPNAWEVGWAMFRFRDLENYYWFILKTNGYELGKKQGSDAQIFLVTGDLPQLVVGRKYRWQITTQGPRIRVFVDGAKIVDFTDPNPLLSGSIGLYEEDSRVRFESVSA